MEAAVRKKAHGLSEGKMKADMNRGQREDQRGQNRIRVLRNTEKSGWALEARQEEFDLIIITDPLNSIE